MTDSVIYTDLVMRPSLEINLEGERIISTIVLHKNTDSDYALMDDLTNMNVMVFDSKNTKVYHSPFFTMSDPITTIDLPANTVALRVVVTLTDDVKRILSLKEVEIFYDMSGEIGHSHNFDIPIGSLFNGTEVNYLTFVQGCEESTDAATHISSMKFLYGSSPDVMDAASKE